MKYSLTALALAALAFAPAPALADPLKVVASFSIIADMASNVGGDRIALTTLVGPDGDTHVYEPKPSDAVAMSRADVILVNGLSFEGYLDRLVEASGTKAPIVSLSDGIAVIVRGGKDDHEDEEHADHDHEDHDHADDAHEEEHDGDHENEEEGHHHGAFDPHSWLSIANALVYVDNIRDAFCVADAEGCPLYQANAETYTDKLEALDAEIKAKVETIPADKRVIISSHDAFAYFGRDYGLTFLAPQGISTDTEPSAADVAALITRIRDEHAAALFAENISDPRVIEQIARETGAAVSSDLYSGALSQPDGPAPTYIDLMRYNIDAISTAIGGD